MIVIVIQCPITWDKSITGIAHHNSYVGLKVLYNYINYHNYLKSDTHTTCDNDFRVLFFP